MNDKEATWPVKTSASNALQMVVNGIEQGIPKYYVCMESFDLCCENTQEENVNVNVKSKFI